jgi:Flp pilus assembly protein TadG
MLRRFRAGAPRLTGDDGFSTLELVLITPFLMAFVLLVVGFGRITHGRQEVQHAAAAAARAASLADTPGQAQTAAQQEAAADLAQPGSAASRPRRRRSTPHSSTPGARFR